MKEGDAAESRGTRCSVKRNTGCAGRMGDGGQNSKSAGSFLWRLFKQVSTADVPLGDYNDGGIVTTPRREPFVHRGLLSVWQAALGYVLWDVRIWVISLPVI